MGAAAGGEAEAVLPCGQVGASLKILGGKGVLGRQIRAPIGPNRTSINGFGAMEELDTVGWVCEIDICSPSLSLLGHGLDPIRGEGGTAEAVRLRTAPRRR